MLTDLELSNLVDDRLASVTDILHDGPHPLAILTRNTQNCVRAVGSVLDEDKILSSNTDSFEHAIFQLAVADLGIRRQISVSDGLLVWKNVAKTIELRQYNPLLALIELVSREIFRYRALDWLYQINLSDLHVGYTTKDIERILHHKTSATPDPAIRAMRLLITQFSEICELAHKQNLPLRNPLILLAISELLTGWKLEQETAIDLWCALANSYGYTSQINSSFSAINETSGAAFAAICTVNANTGAITEIPLRVVDIKEKLQTLAKHTSSYIALQMVVKALEDEEASDTKIALEQILAKTKTQLPQAGIPLKALEIVENLYTNLDYADDLAYFASRLVPLNQRSTRARAAVLLGALELVSPHEQLQITVLDSSVADKWQSVYGKRDKGLATVFDALERIRSSLSLLEAMQQAFAYDQKYLAGIHEPFEFTPSTNTIAQEVLSDIKTYLSKALELLTVLVQNREVVRVTAIDRAISLCAISHFYGLRDRNQPLLKQEIDEWVTLGSRFSNSASAAFLNGVLDAAKLQILG